jgi:MFS family permease
MKSGVFLSHSANSIPSEYRKSFTHLILDIAWYGLLTGSSMSFLVIYITRLHASGEQIGFLNAAPSLVSLIFSLAAGQWLSRRSVGKTVFWASIAHRVFYLLWIPVPFFLGAQGQIWVYISLTLLMYVPGTVLSVGFNALFAQAVPPEWRGTLVGIRNAVFSITTMLTSLGCGVVLTSMTFPTGYQIVFLIGFIGAAMSSVHLYLVWKNDEKRRAQEIPVLEESPAPVHGAKSGSKFRLDILKGPFGIVLLVMGFFHLAHYLPQPLFPLYTVNVLQLTDQDISLGTAVFYITSFLGSLQLAGLSRKWGHKKVTGVGVVLLSVYPGLLAVSHNLFLYLLTSALGGFAWALGFGAVYNYLLERTPDADRPAYIGWFTLVTNAAILVGSLIGPQVSNLIGLVPALIVMAGLRFLAGIAILRWG